MIEAFLRYDFLQNALWVGIMVGFLAPILGVFLVVRRLSLIADALSHITLSGIAFSLLLGKSIPFFSMLNPLYIGMVFSVGGALLIERLRNSFRHYQEVAIPIILSGGIGLGVLFISLADGFNNDLFNYLFGSVMAVSRSDVWTILFITLVVSFVLVVFYKEFFFLSFDEEQATVSGLNRRFFHILFIVMVALVIAASMRVVGILLVSSLMTLPVAAAIRFARGFKQMFIYSVLFSQISVLSGLMAAFQLDIAPGGTIVLIAVIIFIGAVSFEKIKHGKVVHRFIGRAG
ncbi:metal ABC transporter permease [Alkalihalobacillus pseudalcaliphilus]|uniref:metal ABC transporter permease n=1 Tax=Alkalihalobacillus pseudalcaliphilus TaxID=79884 RepID=UPI00064DDCBE|nr:metal ABC transporter permease [Alkalihalobacillus pseudalcaliphilus]KMK75979.1 metal ABC transporter permease [Alkalihalobacillus pseudalcaliphilus]